ncbi:multiple sugar transport system substrate-binding protein [Rhizobium sp. BK313]|uniref:extracellular solute-binding protein n=1 Tax=Rhizobium sp. BK313 TaxID=2587081 RepID=UPI00105D1029|nr:extracellular solute-binding protein [Rhizobium sp. BK313]MBB3458809.1 multiple sugar transport system substrate-binding protein [Rhizobium sp. BK313]
MSLTRRLFLVATALSGVAIASRAANASEQALRLVADTPALYRDIFDVAFAQFASGNGGRGVEVSWTQDYTQTLQQSLREALVGQAPDVALHAHNNIAMLARRGQITPFDGLATAGDEGLRSAIGEVGSRQYAMPFSLSVPVVYINCDLVGRRDTLPGSWDEILSVAAKVDAPSGGAFFNYATDGSWTFMALIESLGGRILNADGTAIAFDSAEGLEAMEILSAFANVRKGEILTASQAREAFASGALGIHVDTTSRLRFFEEQAKDKFTLAVMPFPLKPTPGARMPPSGGSLAIMATDRARQESAYALIRSLLSAEVQRQVLIKTGFIPGLATFDDNDGAIAADLKASSHFSAIAPTLAVLGPWVSFPVDNPARVDRAVQDALSAQAALQANPKDTLERIVAAARQG